MPASRVVHEGLFDVRTLAVPFPLPLLLFQPVQQFIGRRLNRSARGVQGGCAVQYSTCPSIVSNNLRNLGACESRRDAKQVLACPIAQSNTTTGTRA